MTLMQPMLEVNCKTAMPEQWLRVLSTKRRKQPNNCSASAQPSVIFSALLYALCC